MSFSNLGLSDAIVRAVTERGYTEPTPIQAQAIPAVLSGGDLLAGAQTGTGKTAGFTLPILHLLSQGSHSQGSQDHSAESRPVDRRPSASRPSNGRLPEKISQPRKRSPIRALILTPTRELAAQVEESVREYGKYVRLTSMTIFGGVGMNPQVQRLKGGVDILVATPGRLLDHVQQGTVDLSQIEILVLDEADRMLDMGFIRDIRRILALLPKQRQNLLFSATFSSDIKAFASSLLNQPSMIEAERRHLTADTVAQKIYPVDREQKRHLLTHLIKENNWFQVLVFTRTKHGADRLVKQLMEDNIPSLAIHGNKSQSARTRALAKFKDASLQVLVATDIAARGIDISDLPHVVNYELPNVPEDYVHRIGRTGRAGAVGEAVSLVCVDELKLLSDIERLIKQPLPREIVPGFEPNPHAKPEPIQNGQRGQASRGKRPDRAPSRSPHAAPQPRVARHADGERPGARSPVSRRPSGRH